MTFEEWWETEHDYEVSKFEMLRMSKKSLKERKKSVAEEAWNAALEETLNNMPDARGGTSGDYKKYVENQIKRLKTDE